MPAPDQPLWTSYVTSWSPDGTGLLFDNRMVDPVIRDTATTNTRISSTSPSGVTRLIMPQSSACLAGTFSPSSIISMARGRPTARVRR